MNLHFKLHSAAQRRRRGIFVEIRVPINSNSVRSGLFRPDGALDLCGSRFYKDVAPDGAAWILSSTESARFCHLEIPLCYCGFSR